MFVDTMIFFLEGSYLKTSTSLNLHLDILTTWLTPNHRNPPSQVDHQVISRAAKGFPARHNMWSPSRRGKPLALNVTSGTEKKPWLAPWLFLIQQLTWKKRCDVISLNVVPSVHISVYSFALPPLRSPTLSPRKPRAKIRYVAVGWVRNPGPGKDLGGLYLLSSMRV